LSQTTDKVVCSRNGWIKVILIQI